MGKYKEATGEWNTECAACGGCPAGEKRGACGGTHPGECYPCAPGRYKTDTDNTGCIACDSCLLGKFRTNCGDTSAGECKACASGTYKLIEGTGQTMCQDHGECDPGQYRMMATAVSVGSCENCEECNSGTYRTMCAIRTQSPCSVCAMGQFKASAKTPSPVLAPPTERAASLLCAVYSLLSPAPMPAAPARAPHPRPLLMIGTRSVRIARSAQLDNIASAALLQTPDLAQTAGLVLVRRACCGRPRHSRQPNYVLCCPPAGWHVQIGCRKFHGLDSRVP